MLPLPTEDQVAIIQSAATTATELQGDMLALLPRVTSERKRLDRDGLMADEISFWYKSLIHATLSFADGLGHTLREILSTHKDKLEPFVSSKQRAVIDSVSKRSELTRVLSATFRLTPLLFGDSTFRLDTDSSDYRAFTAMISARGRFTHPKTPRDIHPLATLAAMNSAVEWLLHSWRDLLLACSEHLRPSDDNRTRPGRRFPFDDRRLNEFEQLEEEWHPSSGSGDDMSALDEMVTALKKDTQRALDLVNSSDSEPASLSADVALRNLLRFVFTEIEGTVFIATTQLCRYRFSDVQPAKELLIGDDDEVRDQIVETMEAFSRHFGTDAVIQRQGEGWNSFSRSRACRNRLVHPKTGTDLNLRPEEGEDIKRLRRWWHGEVQRCLDLTKDEKKRKLVVARQRAGLREC